MVCTRKDIILKGRNDLISFLPFIVGNDLCVVPFFIVAFLCKAPPYTAKKSIKFTANTTIMPHNYAL